MGTDYNVGGQQPYPGMNQVSAPNDGALWPSNPAPDFYAGAPKPPGYPYAGVPNSQSSPQPGFPGSAMVAPGAVVASYSSFPDPNEPPSFNQGLAQTALGFAAAAAGNAVHMGVLPSTTATMPQALGVNGSQLGDPTLLQAAIAQGPSGPLTTPLMISGFGISVGGRVVKCDRSLITLAPAGTGWVMTLRGQTGRNRVAGVGASSHGVTVAAHVGSGHAMAVAFSQFLNDVQAQLLLPCRNEKKHFHHLSPEQQMLLTVPEVAQVAYGYPPGTFFEQTAIRTLVGGGQIGCAALKLSPSEDVECHFIIRVQPGPGYVDVTVVPLEFKRLQGTLGNAAAQGGVGGVHSGGCSIAYRFMLGRAANAALDALLGECKLPDLRCLPPDVQFLRGEEMSQSRSFASATLLGGWVGICASRASSHWTDGVTDDEKFTSQRDITGLHGVHTDAWSVDLRCARTDPNPNSRRVVAIEVMCRVSLKSAGPHAFQLASARQEAGHSLAAAQNQQIQHHLAGPFNLPLPTLLPAQDASATAIEVSCLISAEDCQALAHTDLGLAATSMDLSDWHDPSFAPLTHDHEAISRQAINAFATKVYDLLKHRDKWPQVLSHLLRLGRTPTITVHVLADAYDAARIASADVTSLATPLVDPDDPQAVMARLGIMANARKALERALAQALGDTCSSSCYPQEFTAAVAEWQAALSTLDQHAFADPDASLMNLMLQRPHHRYLHRGQHDFYRAASLYQRAVALCEDADPKLAEDWITAMHAELADLTQRDAAGALPGALITQRYQRYATAVQSLLQVWTGQAHRDKHHLTNDLQAMQHTLRGMSPSQAAYRAPPASPWSGAPGGAAHNANSAAGQTFPWEPRPALPSAANGGDPQSYASQTTSWADPPGYEPPPTDRTGPDSYVPPQPGFGDPPGYLPPSDNFGNSNGYVPPQPGFGDPPGYLPPSENFDSSTPYVPPQPGFGDPPGYAPPSDNFGSLYSSPPQPGFGDPPGYAPPSNDFGNPPGYAPPSNDFGNFYAPPPQPGFGDPPGYVPPPSDFGDNYGAGGAPQWGGGNTPSDPTDTGPIWGQS